jgi:hypothetical protein
MFPRIAWELESVEPTLGTAGRRDDEVARCEDMWRNVDKLCLSQHGHWTVEPVLC